MIDKYSYLVPFLLNIVRYIVLAGIPFIVFYVLFPHLFSKSKIQSRWAKRKDFLREVLYSLQTTIILALVIIVVLYSPLRELTRFYSDIHTYPLWWMPVSLGLAFIIHDTYFYWMHRIIHHPKLFHSVHLVHHKSVNPSPLASYSFHFLEAMLEALVAPIILMLLPVHPIVVILFGFSSFVINVYGHLGYEIAPRWFRNSFLFEFITTSTYHNMHHAIVRYNYGLYFRVWDKVMGTESPHYVDRYDEIQHRRFGIIYSTKRTT